MISVGIDISKDKSTVCILKPYGEVIRSPYEITHTNNQLLELVSLIKSFGDETRVILEATGNYHLPVLSYLEENDIFVAVINPLVMKKYVNTSLRRAKTDKIDAIKIANYGLDNWYHLIKYQPSAEAYAELKILGRQYAHYIQLRIESKLALTNILGLTMPGIKNLLSNRSIKPEKDKLNDFVGEYWHFDNIRKMSQEEFISSYSEWAKRKGYHKSESKAISIYKVAQSSIPILSANTRTQILVLESVRVLHEIDKTLALILTEMQEVARGLQEYELVRNLNGVGEVLAVKLIAEIGDVRIFHSSNALIAYAV